MAAQIAGTLLSTATGYVQAVLAPQVEQAAEDALHEAIVAMDVIAFEDSDFVELTSTAHNATSRLRVTVRTVGDLISSLVSMAAAVVTATLLHPALAPLVLLTALPQAWASVRAARINNHSYIAMTSRMRRLSATSCLLMNPAEAAEVRAYTAGPLLLAEHRRIAASLLREGLARHRRVTRVQLAGRGMSGVASGIAYLILGTLVYLGALPLAIAGTAVLAMRTAAGAVSSTMHSANNLYEASF
jgi:ATP-binding cassette subfamily B protein